MYYYQLLHEQRDNIKSTWQTLNALIKKSKQSSTYPESFDDNGKCVSDKNVVVNKFNQYFVNVGVDLANKIPVPKQNKSFHDYMPKTNECNLFLSPVLQEDIITTVNNWVIPCQINQFFAKFARPDSDFDEIWHTWRLCLKKIL